MTEHKSTLSISDIYLRKPIDLDHHTISKLTCLFCGWKGVNVTAKTEKVDPDEYPGDTDNVRRLRCPECNGRKLGLTELLRDWCDADRQGDTA